MILPTNIGKRIELQEKLGANPVYLDNLLKNFDDYKNFFSESFNNCLDENTDIISRRQFPKISIEAYYQSTVIQSLLNLLTSFVNGVDSITNANQTGSLDKGAIEEKLGKMKDKATETMQKEDWDDVFTKLLAGITPPGGDIAFEQLPYVLMLGLAGVTKLATFEIPFFSPELMKSDGRYGWSSSKLGWFLQGGTHGGDFSLLKTLGSFTTPMFNPNNGGNSNQTTTIEFDLFNDTKKKVETNTNFIKSLVISNTWAQYGVFQTPGALYNIKFGSAESKGPLFSMYMCTGEFTITKKGVMRLFDDYYVPDVYNVKATFSSLLPNNLNTYLFSKFNNNNLSKDGALPQLLDNAKNALAGK